MKAKLLKRIRRDKRFLIEKRYNQKGFEYSGWWYCDDLKLNKSVKHKRLKNVLDWLVNIYRWQFWLKFSAYFVFSCLLSIFIIHIIHKLNP